MCGISNVAGHRTSIDEKNNEDMQEGEGGGGGGASGMALRLQL